MKSRLFRISEDLANQIEQEVKRSNMLLTKVAASAKLARDLEKSRKMREAYLRRKKLPLDWERMNL